MQALSILSVHLFISSDTIQVSVFIDPHNNNIFIPVFFFFGFFLLHKLSFGSHLTKKKTIHYFFSSFLSPIRCIVFLSNLPYNYLSVCLHLSIYLNLTQYRLISFF